MRHKACFFRLIMKDSLKCYISGRLLPGESRQGIVSFAVPEYGILFRCQAEGSRIDLEVIALMIFLRFADHNIPIFGKKNLQILTDSPVLAFIMNHKSGGGKGVETVRKEAREFAKKMAFEIALIDSKSNRASKSVANIPEMPIGTNLRIKTLAPPTTPDLPGWHSGNQNP